MRPSLIVPVTTTSGEPSDGTPQLFDLMSELKRHGMKAAFDEIMATAVKRQHEPQRIVGDLLNAEISEKQARSIKYRLHHRQVAARQRPRCLPVRGHADKSDAVGNLTFVRVTWSRSVGCRSASFANQAQ